MPTYEYRCSDCGASLERRQRFDESPLTQCPTCGGTLRRVFFPAGIVFKGSGWYCTDSRPKPKSESGEGGSKCETASTAA
ncbi:MAG: FmdB family zinc ribbon protein [Sphingomonadaceae bacterium]